MVRIGGDINGIELESGDTIDVNGNTWTYQSDGTLVGPAIDTDDARISGTTPGIRLSGTETNAADLTIRENAGTIELYDEGAGAVAASWNLNPDLEIGNTTHAATDHESGGSLELTHNNLAITSSDHHARPVAGTLLSEDGSNNFNVDIATDTETASGDGALTTFTLAHSLGEVPTVAQVQPTSADAAGSFYVSNKTSADIDVTYGTAPASGTDNLTFDIITA